LIGFVFGTAALIGVVLLILSMKDRLILDLFSPDLASDPVFTNFANSRTIDGAATSVTCGLRKGFQLAAALQLEK